MQKKQTKLFYALTLKRLLSYAVVLCTGLASTLAMAQDDAFLKRLSVIQPSKKVVFYNIDGMQATSEVFNQPYSAASVTNMLRSFRIDKNVPANKYIELPFEHVHVTKSDTISENLTQHNHYYFFKNKQGTSSAVSVSSINKRDMAVEHQLVTAIYNNRIPKNLYAPLTPTQLRLTDKPIYLNKRCRWAGVNNIQCLRNGEFNWSFHKDLADAKQALLRQFQKTQLKPFKLISIKEALPVTFLGMPAQAKKMVISPKGAMASMLKQMGTKHLTIYYIATQLDDKALSFVFSHWNDDQLTANGLPPILAKLMTVENTH